MLRPDDVPIIHFVVLCVVPIVAASYAWRFRRRQPLRAAGVGSLFVLSMWSLSIPAFITYCGHREDPEYQMLIPLGSA